MTRNPQARKDIPRPNFPPLSALAVMKLKTTAIARNGSSRIPKIPLKAEGVSAEPMLNAGKAKKTIQTIGRDRCKIDINLIGW